MSNELFDIHAEHRPDAVTLATNPTAEFALDFDNLFTVSIALPLPVPVEFSHDAQDWDERDKSDGGTFIVYCLVHSQFILWATHRGQWRRRRLWCQEEGKQKGQTEAELRFTSETCSR